MILQRTTKRASGAKLTIERAKKKASYIEKSGCQHSSMRDGSGPKRTFSEEVKNSGRSKVRSQ